MLIVQAIFLLSLHSLKLREFTPWKWAFCPKRKWMHLPVPGPFSGSKIRCELRFREGIPVDSRNSFVFWSKNGGWVQVWDPSPTQLGFQPIPLRSCPRATFWTFWGVKGWENGLEIDGLEIVYYFGLSMLDFSGVTNFIWQSKCK